MAAGSSAPELATAVIAVFIAEVFLNYIYDLNIKTPLKTNCALKGSIKKKLSYIKTEMIS